MVMVVLYCILLTWMVLFGLLHVLRTDEQKYVIDGVVEMHKHQNSSGSRRPKPASSLHSELHVASFCAPAASIGRGSILPSLTTLSSAFLFIVSFCRLFCFVFLAPVTAVPC